MNHAPQSVLVLGGTGFVGRALLERMVERNGGGGGRILVPTRRAAHGNLVRFLPGVDVELADVHQDGVLPALLRRCDAVVNLVGILHGDREAFRHVHVELPRRLAAACKAAGTGRVVHVSALGVGPDAPSEYLRSKTEGEAELRDAGLDLAILRPSVVFGSEDHFLNLFAQLQRLFPVIPLASAGARFQPVWVEDLAEAIVRLLDMPQALAVVEATGPEVFSLAELVQMAGRWSGHERRVVPLPEAFARLQARLLECLPGEPPMSRDNLDSMTRPSVASGQLPGLQALGIVPTALGAVAPQYLADAGPTPMDRRRASARRT